jgi:hypothetical protein
VIDVACPACGPSRKAPSNRSRKVLRLFNKEPGFLTYNCTRCGEHGFAHESNRSRNPIIENSRFFKPVVDAQEQAAKVLAQAKADAEETAKKLQTARYLWSRRQPIAGSIAERYLRIRGYGGALPATLGFLPANNGYEPSMIAAFGVPEEPGPGILAMPDDAVRGVHLTKLKPDGSGKAGTDKDKIMLGRCLGLPIVVAPMNDLLGLVICEGIEKGLCTHDSTGLGVWVAGAAGRLPALVDVVPDYVDCVTVIVDDDPVGTKHSKQFVAGLMARGIHVEPTVPTPERVA